MPHYTKDLKEIIKGLKKASKLHAGIKIEKDQRTRYKNSHTKKTTKKK